jgi:hypothetical protein
MSAWTKVGTPDPSQERWERGDGLSLAVSRTPHDSDGPMLGVRVWVNQAGGRSAKVWQFTMVEHEFLLWFLREEPFDADARAEVGRHRAAGTHPTYHGMRSFQGPIEGLLTTLDEGIAMRSGPKIKNQPIQWSST